MSDEITPEQIAAELLRQRVNNLLPPLLILAVGALLAWHAFHSHDRFEAISGLTLLTIGTLDLLAVLA